MRVQEDMQWWKIHRQCGKGHAYIPRPLKNCRGCLGLNETATRAIHICGTAGLLPCGVQHCSVVPMHTTLLYTVNPSPRPEPTPALLAR
mmetsp:Transcript_37252/g.60702  ORF Transcript_37252/g.60702 Transcript_37252/m.60702 type:complete len:89 (-) Transcript_37252:1049-1315(-)